MPSQLLQRETKYTDFHRSHLLHVPQDVDLLLFHQRYVLTDLTDKILKKNILHAINFNIKGKGIAIPVTGCGGP
jgi:hypothetical protein